MKLKPEYQKLFLILLILTGILTLVPHLFNPRVDGGQLSKQTHDAAWALSYAQGKTFGIFPLRNFLEIYHQDIIPWATEFPIYTFTVGTLHKVSGVPLITCGRLLSFSLYLFLLLGGWRFGRELNKKEFAQLDLLLPFFLTWFPVFRIYGVSFMPDIGMTAFSLWGLYYCFRESWGKAALALMVAALFKYYAVFITMGAVLYLFHRASTRTFLVKASVLLLGALPSVLFVIYFMLMKISNPIIDYLNINHHGHFSSTGLLFSLKLYQRIFTWLVIKNPSVPGTLLAFIGLYFILGQARGKGKGLIEFLLPFIIGQVFFILIFAHGFYIHDYYSLPTTLLTAFSAAMGGHFLLQIHKSSRAAFLIFFLLAIFLAGFSWTMTRSALHPQPFYARMAQEIGNLTGESDRILVIGDRATELPLFESGRTGWMIPFRDLQGELLSPHLPSLFSRHRVQWVLLYCLGEDAKERGRNVQAAISGVAPGVVLEKKSEELIFSSDKKVPSAFYTLYKVLFTGT